MMENLNQNSLVEIELINQRFDINKTKMVELLNDLRFKYFESILDLIYVEEAGDRIIWWIWDQGYKERTKKIIYGYFDIHSSSIYNEQPIYFRMVCNYLPVYQLFLEMLVVIHSSIVDPGNHLQFLIKWEVKKDIVTKSSSSTGIYFIPKPVFGSSIEEWLDYYHRMNNYAKQNKLKRYTFEDLAKDSRYASGTLRTKHVGCPLCKKFPRISKDENN